VAGLRKLGLPPILVGKRPVMGRCVVAAGEAALAAMARGGLTRRELAAALEGFGARLPEGLPDQGIPVRKPASDEILNRWLGAMANEALRLMEQGIARRPSDVDHALVAGYGFPRWRGGPMHQADRRGLLVLRSDLRAWAAEDALWLPAPLLDRLIGEGRRLADLDR
jgi:3-hydroxyacyl-CoA dehydrogenase